jgi:hypothetical protein
VTRYAIDQERGVLMASWATGAGDTAITVAALPEGCPPERAGALALALAGFSDAAWHTYTHPVSAADSLEENSEGWLRQSEREAFAKATDAIRSPNLPEHGMIVQSYVAVEETAHRVGRALYAIGHSGLTDLVVREAGEELASVEAAERGELVGRARQAVVMSRADASPVQVAEADRLLAADPLGGDELFTRVDPTAAAVAAAHWLHSAAAVAALASGTDLRHVVEASGDIEALAHTTPTLVLHLLEDGASPREAVTALIREAMLVAEGIIPDPAGLVGAVARVVGQAEDPDADDEDQELAQDMLAELRATPLDPSRPALDLLEDLLAGIHGCRLIYEQADGDGDDRDREGSADREGSTDAALERAGRDDESTAVFLDLVRAEAARTADRLV